MSRPPGRLTPATLPVTAGPSRHHKGMGAFHAGEIEVQARLLAWEDAGDRPAHTVTPALQRPWPAVVRRPLPAHGRGLRQLRQVHPEATADWRERGESRRGASFVVSRRAHTRARRWCRHVHGADHIGAFLVWVAGLVGVTAVRWRRATGAVGLSPQVVLEATRSGPSRLLPRSSSLFMPGLRAACGSHQVVCGERESEDPIHSGSRHGGERASHPFEPPRGGALHLGMTGSTVPVMTWS